MIVPSEASKHVILICKGHHDEDDTLEALRKWNREYCALPTAYVANDGPWQFLLEACTEVLSKRDFARMLTDAFRYKESVGLEYMMREMIGALSVIQVFKDGETLIDLGLEKAGGHVK